MRKLMILLLSLATAVAYAQPNVERSEPIEEPPNAGYDKLLLLKDSKTCYAHYSGDGALDINIYSAAHKLITTGKITSERWDADDFKSTTVLGTYEINNEIVIFLQQTNKKHPILYRLRINPDDGKLLKEDVIATTKRGNSFLIKDFVQTQMKVVKDTKSGCYAVIYYDNLDEEADDAIKVMHFDEKHTLLSTARVTSPDQKIKHVGFLDAAVQGNKSVFITTYYTGNAEEESKIYISRLNAGETTLSTKPLDFTEDFHKSNVQMLYNYTANNVQMLIVTFVKSKRKTNVYLSYLCNVNPETLGVGGINELSNEKINDYARTNLASENDFTGVPQWMLLNKSDEPVIIRQSMAQIYTTTSKGATYISGTSMEDIGISEMAADGTEKQSYLLPHHSSTSQIIDVMYMKDMHAGGWTNPYQSRKMNVSMQYHSFRYITGMKNSYLVHLAYKKNIENPENEKWRKSDHKSSKTNAAYYVMRNGNVTKGFLFGKPVGKKDHTTCFMDAADQNDNGLFATIITEKKGKSNECRIAWVTFE